MSVLKTELRTDPLKMGYMSYLPDCPGVVADKLNATTQIGVTSRYVNARTVLSELGAQGVDILESLRFAAASIPAVYWILPFIQTESGVDVGAPFCQTMIDTLAMAGKLTSDQATALKNLAKQPISRAQQLGLGIVSATDVTNAFLE
ncbi:MAG TPA: hypothetical protein VFM18_13850 [Methanosarcina sp.]|nr:hypothetical protein [Methanosarcina sp.]